MSAVDPLLTFGVPAESRIVCMNNLGSARVGI
jgi:hypothetical protein